jgi:2-polyprenyl-6-methoxyphenol hydroxylase-like FAD-dependent oxidoreductase
VWLIRPTPLARPLLSAGSARLDAWVSSLLDVAPALGTRVATGTVEGPLRGVVGLPSYVRRAVGPGWALVGDAGYHRDPITGHGMTDAFRDAELLARAADRALRAPRDCQEELLQDYQWRRDAALAPSLRVTAALSAFPAPSRFIELQHELSTVLEEEAYELAALPRHPFAADLVASRRASA